MEAEDIAHQYHMLKIDHNEMKTKHKQLQAKVRSLMHDLDNSYKDNKALTDQLHRVTQDNRIASSTIETQVPSSSPVYSQP